MMNPGSVATLSYSARAVALVSCVCQYTRPHPRSAAQSRTAPISARPTPCPRAERVHPLIALELIPRPVVHRLRVVLLVEGVVAAEELFPRRPVSRGKL